MAPIIRKNPPECTLDPSREPQVCSRAKIGRNCNFKGRQVMAVVIRKYKLASGMAQTERIDDPDRIERYLRLFDKEDVKKLETGVKVWIEKDEWQLLPQ